MKGAGKMSTPECRLSQDSLKEIKLQVNQRLFEAGLISSDVFRLAQERILDEKENAETV